jgi:hypothetical protein
MGSGCYQIQGLSSLYLFETAGMERIQTLLQKLTELSRNDNKPSAIDLDLMLDYTRVMYADLLEWRNRVAFTTSLSEETSQPFNAVTEPAMPANTAPPIELTENVRNYDTSAEDKPSEHDIRKSIGINDKYQFISELFSNDKETYENVLDNINKARSYQQAIDWLDEHAHSSNAWDDDMPVVQSFYSVVSNFFVSR